MVSEISVFKHPIFGKIILINYNTDWEYVVPRIYGEYVNLHYFRRH